MQDLRPAGFHIGIGLKKDIWHFPDLILKSRLLRALEEGIARYPIHRELRFAARTDLAELFDDLALNLGFRAQRIDGHHLLLDGGSLLIAASGSRKADYCSCYFDLWADRPETAESAREAILARVEGRRIREPMFSVSWYFRTGKGDLEQVGIEELADDRLLDEAYPELSGGISDFIRRYLDAPETVLVLQGPPGTGKTRLIRAILGEMSRRNGGRMEALYTGDKQALENDEIFVKFITGWEDAFVVEDADHVLKPRAEGNEHLHRFLAIADGVIRAQGRKIIFSTNLPNLRDLDEALVRPGRCFARLSIRELTATEARRLSERLCGEAGRAAAAWQRLEGAGRRGYTLAEVYSACGGAAQDAG